MLAAPLVLPRAASPARSDADLVAKLMGDGAYGAAWALLRPRIVGGSADPVALDQAATCLWHLDDAAQAMAVLQRLVDGWPQLGRPCVKLASYAASCGDRARALAALDLAFSRGARTAQGLALLNRLDPIARDGALARRLKGMAGDSSLPKLDQAIAQNTLGRIEDRAGRTRAAFRWFSAANRSHGAPYCPDDISALVAGQVRLFDPACIPDDEAEGPRLVFITGLPRSGTTVLDHSLARHSQIRPLGESPALSRTVMAMRREVGSTGAWDWLLRLGPTDRTAFRRYFLSYLPVGAVEDGQVLISKMPLDCFDLGAAAWLWPQARFVHLSRHPMDVGLSNFTTLFHQGHGFSRRLDWMAHMIRAVDRSVSDYRAKLGDALRVQSYRALVDDPEGVLRAILSHIGLPWEGACLSPETGGRPVQTASIGQVDRGVNRDGLGKWHRYADQLQPLAHALDPEWLRNWEAQDAS
ncbi:sulfotransferase family protein [Aestuariivita boseongensis]|uniref:sulfotransferase family protein n=1 Tax=Aestuariivita boseongensis TaxID=1470562 RepID=UPI0006815109|nr:sulfotransferase [Aestuariivita boseongensis]